MKSMKLTIGNFRGIIYERNGSGLLEGLCISPVEFSTALKSCLLFDMVVKLGHMLRGKNVDCRFLDDNCFREYLKMKDGG
jgi:hypothetical protein